MAQAAKILVVDDEPSVRWAFEKTLKKAGYEVALAETGTKGLALFESFQPDLTLLDIRMPEMDGLQVLERVRGMRSDAQVIVMTAYSDMDTTVAAMKLGAYDFLTKPFNIDECLLLIARGLAARRAAADLPAQTAVSTTGGLKGNSPPMQEVYKLIGRVSAEDVTVLVTGESGSGKELVAQAIHYNSNRSAKPFWAINCTAITESLMESELFGYEKGAFTGAVAAKPGVFELAQGGTLFLDEIGDMSLEMQAQLLRVLEERQIVRVGGNKRIKVDVRIIAATNKDLRKAIQEGRVREDLYHRIKVIEIRLPPLRQRREDIPLLARYFIGQYANQKKTVPKVLSEEAMACLVAYNWPGNVRELKNVIDQVCTLTRDQIILVDHLPPEIRRGAPASTGLPARSPEPGGEPLARPTGLAAAGSSPDVLPKPGPATGAVLPPGGPAELPPATTPVVIGAAETVAPAGGLPEDLVGALVAREIKAGRAGEVYEHLMDQVEKELLRQALALFKGNQVQTANFLGITRNTLRAKIEKYEL
ncbi:MAG: Response regulator of zinc sigma-54-dependent two-component system [Candidatus Ozemobacter sibiricus]|uniref:DNA-binding transcriptional regulator NtrC n=1 Tax=Candidatus Ozemobacter sibiricus TaxID=2268124 RepID=A0A367ZKZ9_9BACT|nr:MAG: Response regulator of zinc sigma-54-dependent two-component system [Candidatus Ozemobacter sibiricus]